MLGFQFQGIAVLPPLPVPAAASTDDAAPSTVESTKRRFGVALITNLHAVILFVVARCHLVKRTSPPDPTTPDAGTLGMCTGVRIVISGRSGKRPARLRTGRQHPSSPHSVALPLTT